jgi:hypothetical protein
MKSRTFLILLALVFVIGGVFNFWAFQSLQTENVIGGASFGRQREAQQPATVSPAAQQAMLDRGWTQGGGTGVGNAAVFRGAIMQASASEFQRQAFPDGVPAYEGEMVTAYVEVPSSGKKIALTPNQSGEYPKVVTQPGEAVEVRLAFTRSQPGEAVAVSAQDGGVLHVGKMAGKLEVNTNREVGLGFVVSTNPGIHRITFTTSGGEAKTLNFWAGPEHTVNKRLVAQLNGRKEPVK